MKRLFLGLLLLALATGGGLSLLASEAPDGLEHTMQKVGGFEDKAIVNSPMPGYQVPVVKNKLARKALAGASGTLAVLGLTFTVGWVLRRARGSKSKDEKSAS